MNPVIKERISEIESNITRLQIELHSNEAKKEKELRDLLHEEIKAWKAEKTLLQQKYRNS